MKRIFLALLLVLSQSVAAESVVSYIRHNGLVTQLTNGVMRGDEDGPAERLLSFTSTDLITDLDEKSPKARIDAYFKHEQQTQWITVGKTLIIYDKDDRVIYRGRTSQVKYKFFKDRTPSIREAFDKPYKV